MHPTRRLVEVNIQFTDFLQKFRAAKCVGWPLY